MKSKFGGGIYSKGGYLEDSPAKRWNKYLHRKSSASPRKSLMYVRFDSYTWFRATPVYVSAFDSEEDKTLSSEQNDNVKGIAENGVSFGVRLIRLASHAPGGITPGRE